ncbi:hypothetical protein CKC_04015 [Candidatus Liberibacter solanacearum CLso-ZC1]|uniref:Uncharacterized protein n=1 Tax=Liberibacter solanacearum (strain CLso-ZC1) TaxID=658172 RepID=E4UB73_LIBSC|nr:hypothetical protein CKC_04015 [Candidatus Liberibacter solanacearum CLso-ZC1]
MPQYSHDEGRKAALYMLSDLSSGVTGEYHDVVWISGCWNKRRRYSCDLRRVKIFVL